MQTLWAETYISSISLYLNQSLAKAGDRLRCSGQARLIAKTCKDVAYKLRNSVRLTRGTTITPGTKAHVVRTLVYTTSHDTLTPTPRTCSIARFTKPRAENSRKPFKASSKKPGVFKALAITTLWCKHLLWTQKSENPCRVRASRKPAMQRYQKTLSSHGMRGGQQIITSRLIFEGARLVGKTD